MNAIWRFKNKIVTIPKYKTTLPQQVVQEFDISNFTSGKNYLIYKANFETGRSWKACELRLKSTLTVQRRTGKFKCSTSWVSRPMESSTMAMQLK